MSETKKTFAAGLSLLAALIVLSASTASGVVGGAFTEISGNIETPEPTPVEPRILIPHKLEGFLTFPVKARAVLVKDKDTGTVLLEKNPQVELPIASLTKLMTALVVAKRLELDEAVTVTPADTKVAPYRVGLLAGEQILVKDLLKAMLVSSANDAAMSLARAAGPGIEAFVAEMNNEAKLLGMKKTSFANPVGFDDRRQYSTAEDLSILVEEFLHNPDLLAMTSLRYTAIFSVDGKYGHDITSTNKLLAYQNVLGLKTGYTAEARGNLILLVDADNDLSERRPQYYSIVLGSFDREQETENIMSWIEKNYVWK